MSHQTLNLRFWFSSILSFFLAWKFPSHYQVGSQIVRLWQSVEQWSHAIRSSVHYLLCPLLCLLHHIKQANTCVSVLECEQTINIQIHTETMTIVCGSLYHQNSDYYSRSAPIHFLQLSIFCISWLLLFSISAKCFDTFLVSEWMKPQTCMFVSLGGLLFFSG